MTGKIRKNATTIQVESHGSKTRVNYVERDEVITVEARAEIVACPKCVGKRIVKGLPAEQFQAINAMRHAQPGVVGRFVENLKGSVAEAKSHPKSEGGMAPI